MITALVINVVIILVLTILAGVAAPRRKNEEAVEMFVALLRVSLLVWLGYAAGHFIRKNW